jgi:integral membrane protein
MPMKYIWGNPLAVRYVGMTHGALFVLLCLTLAWVMRKHQWELKRGIKVFIAALIPFGPLLVDKDLRMWDEEAAGEAPEA